ncbi:hypothetical protein CDAR_538001 [Caerostris darwini]|uniref:Uncharacterized protein n=1 Tax=Caerostris darwini TaxID=1538125 RepID=A0AAV4R3M8_9ARAC|nr:hypothetical protein CDAR_538001 [Caerostris darwini]
MDKRNRIITSSPQYCRQPPGLGHFQRSEFQANSLTLRLPVIRNQRSTTKFFETPLPLPQGTRGRNLSCRSPRFSFYKMPVPLPTIRGAKREFLIMT